MIEVAGISKSYGKHQILTDVSFEVNSGQSVAIVGMNGCGKTTLMKILAGVIKPDSGDITYFGTKTGNNRKLFKQYCGYVPQENPLMEELSVKDNLSLWRGQDKSIEKMIIDRFDLDGIMKKPVKTLSGGMKRRLSIACTLLSWPPILILDEPTTALDLYYKNSIQTWLQDYCKLNGIVVMTTHDEAEILSADRCLFMADGKLRDMGKIKDMDRITKEINYGSKI